MSVTTNEKPTETPNETPAQTPPTETPGTRRGKKRLPRKYEQIEKNLDVLMKAKAFLSPMARLIIALHILSDPDGVKIIDMLELIKKTELLSKLSMYNWLTKLEAKGIVQIERTMDVQRNIRSMIRNIRLTEEGKEIATALLDALSKIKWG